MAPATRVPLGPGGQRERQRRDLTRLGERLSRNCSGLRSAVLGPAAVFGGVTAVGPVLGPGGGELVAVELGEVVGCHQ